MAPHVFSAASALLVAAASLCSVGEVAALPSAWTTLPKPPAKLSHQHSKCGWLDVCEQCVHKDGAWKKVNAPSGTYCDDGYYCNGHETCDANGKCKRGDPVDCEDEDANVDWGDIHPNCGKAVCSERHKSCKVAIKPGSCRDGDKCTTQDQCDLVTGQCVGIPKWCGSECHECDSATGNCGRGCGPKQDCKWGTCVPEPKEKTCSGHKVCNAKGCKWIGCGECEECKWGKCLPVECPHGKECVADPDSGEHECKKPEVECKKNKDCFKACQFCKKEGHETGVCTDKLDKSTCECPHLLKKKMCKGCDGENCVVTKIDAENEKILQCSCDTSVEMTDEM